MSSSILPKEYPSSPAFTRKIVHIAVSHGEDDETIQTILGMFQEALNSEEGTPVVVTRSELKIQVLEIPTDINEVYVEPSILFDGSESDDEEGTDDLEYGEGDQDSGDDDDENQFGYGGRGVSH
jgi:hypothetical protein